MTVVGESESNSILQFTQLVLHGSDSAQGLRLNMVQSKYLAMEPGCFFQQGSSVPSKLFVLLVEIFYGMAKHVHPLLQPGQYHLIHPF